MALMSTPKDMRPILKMPPSAAPAVFESGISPGMLALPSSKEPSGLKCELLEACVEKSPCEVPLPKKSGPRPVLSTAPQLKPSECVSERDTSTTRT